MLKTKKSQKSITFIAVLIAVTLSTFVGLFYDLGRLGSAILVGATMIVVVVVANLTRK